MKAKSKQRQRSFPFLRINERENKPRKRGLTEIRGPYYSVVGRRYLEDLFETMGNSVDSLKFDGGSFTLMPAHVIRGMVDPWRTDVPARFIDEIGMEKLMFEAADPDVFAWYIKNYGADVNLFVDHSQIVQLECLRAGIWGTKSLWGRVVTYKESRE